MNIPKESVDKDAFIELAANLYLFGNKTVYSEIKQLDLGQICEISQTGALLKRYYYHYNEIDNSSKEELKKKIMNASLNAFYRIKSAIDNRPVVISMSGGYDSRFVACMLKKVGVTNVSCYSYGKSSSFEVKQARKNAEALGYRWICVEHTDELMANMLDDECQRYLDSYTGHDFTAYVQNFAAVRKLHHDGWFEPNSVFLTGLCGDMPTGVYIKSVDSSYVFTPKSVAERIFTMLFNRFEVSSALRNKWVNKLTEEITSFPLEINDYQSWQSMVDCIYTSTCHVHYYMHMNTVHSFWGYEWLLPYWDSQLLDAWYSVPSLLKKDQLLYQEILLDELCAPYGINQKKTVVSYTEKKWRKRLLYSMGGMLNFVFLNIGIPFKRNSDYSNFAPFELSLFKKIRTTNMVNYKRSGMMQLLDHFLMERRYGIDNYRFFVENTKNRI